MQALANNVELAGKASVRAVMLIKQEDLNVAFGGTAGVPPLEPRMLGTQTPSLGPHVRTSGALS
jgi:hypothetical protein